MEQQGRYHYSLIGLCMLLAGTGCRPPVPTAVPGIYWQRTAVQAQSRLGITYVNQAPFSGYLFSCSESGDTIDIQGYLNGREQGARKTFYPNGAPASERFYNNGTKTGQYRAWWPNGQVKMEYHFENGEYEGLCREWMADGTLIKSMHYMAGHEAGLQQAWYPDGRIKSNYLVKEGRRYGLLGTKNCNNVSNEVTVTP